MIALPADRLLCVVQACRHIKRAEVISEKIAARLDEYGITQNSHLCLALSGGMDSIVLLHILSALRSRYHFKLSALHINHGLQKIAAQWPAFCAQQCARLNVRLRTRAVQITNIQQSGIEAAARLARYRAFAAEKADWIVLAHHLDDQAETVLYRLLRGTGSRGVAAMRVCDQKRRLLRPMLDASRAQIEQYAQDNELDWVEDPTNSDPRFARNHLRKNIFPLLAEHFPDPAPALARAAAHFAQDADLLEQLAAIDLAHCGGEPLSVQMLLALPTARVLNVLRYLFIRRHCRPPARTYLHEFLQQLTQMHAKRHAHSWPVASNLLVLWRGRLSIECAPAANIPAALTLPQPLTAHGFCLPWAGGTIEALPCIGSGISAERLAAACDEDESVCFSRRWQRAKMQLNADRPSRTLKNLFQENGISALWRDALPILHHRQQIIWVARLGVAQSWRCQAGAHGWQLYFHPPSIESD